MNRDSKMSFRRRADAPQAFRPIPAENRVASSRPKVLAMACPRRGHLGLVPCGRGILRLLFGAGAHRTLMKRGKGAPNAKFRVGDPQDGLATQGRDALATKKAIAKLCLTMPPGDRAIRNVGFNQGRWAAVAVAIVLIWMLAAPCRACFSIVAGKGASTDGCVIVGHNENDDAPQIVNHYKVPRKSYPPGSRVSLRNGGSLEQVPQTWAYLWSEMPGMLFSDSYLNEWGVTICSDNCPSREDKPQLTDGGIGYMLRRLVAERARTAREGVMLVGQLVERFGYIDSGRTYIIADPNEGWLCCVVNGKHWLARRVPDGEVAMVANTYTIRGAALDDTANVLASRDIVEYAKSRGWYNPTGDGPFDFAAAYASPKAATNINNFGRQWSGLKYVSGEPLQPGPHLPFSVVPRQRLSVKDVMRILRHDKQSESDPAARDSPFVCALCSGRTQMSFVAQLRKDRPAPIGLVYWVCLASPRTSFYVPFHFGISDFPASYHAESVRPTSEVFDRRVRAPFGTDLEEAFWLFSNFRDKIDGKGPATAAKVRAQAERLEREAVACQAAIEKAAAALYETDKTSAAQILENYSKGIYLSCVEAMHTILSPN